MRDARPPADRSGRPLRIGYLSGDFRAHATAHLLRSLFAVHDRARVEVHAYALNAADGSAYYDKLCRDADRFVHLDALDDEAAAARIREDDIHILMDLHGHTRLARPGILARRPAPVQAAWLGYPGTTGAEWIDYVIADPIVLPEDLLRHFSETPVWLPESYQINDRWQEIASVGPSRAETGLPEGAFVFCGFNNAYKLEPGVFGRWMDILKRVPGSVLWLLGGGRMETNLRREAARQEVDPARLVFAAFSEKSRHLARLAHADLFLDTFICGAHTTASDALWAGVPVLNCPGEGFASRVGVSLLQAVGLPELICAGRDEYVARAVALATTERKALAALRARLWENRLTQPLFDTERFARHLEDAFELMWEAHIRGDRGTPIHVPPRPS